LEAWLALAGGAVEFPLMPRTGHVVAVEPAFAERAAHVVAGVRHGAEFVVAERQRDLAVLHADPPQDRVFQLVGRADVDPGLRHDSAPSGVTRLRSRPACPARAASGRPRPARPARAPGRWRASR